MTERKLPGNKPPSGVRGKQVTATLCDEVINLRIGREVEDDSSRVPVGERTLTPFQEARAQERRAKLAAFAANPNPIQYEVQGKDIIVLKSPLVAGNSITINSGVDSGSVFSGDLGGEEPELPNDEALTRLIKHTSNGDTPQSPWFDAPYHTVMIYDTLVASLPAMKNPLITTNTPPSRPNPLKLTGEGDES